MAWAREQLTSNADWGNHLVTHGHKGRIWKAVDLLRERALDHRPREFLVGTGAEAALLELAVCLSGLLAAAEQPESRGDVVDVLLDVGWDMVSVEG